MGVHILVSLRSPRLSCLFVLALVRGVILWAWAVCHGILRVRELAFAVGLDYVEPPLVTRAQLSYQALVLLSFEIVLLCRVACPWAALL